MTNSTGVQPEHAWLRWAPILITLLAAGFEYRHFLGEGLPISFDAHSHLARSWMVHRALTAGSFPTWSNDWYGGYRLHGFYAPAYHLVSGALALLTRDVIFSSKLVIWAGQVLAAVGVYLLIQRTARSPWLGIFAALFFLRNEELTLLIGVIGNYPTLVIYALMPLLMMLVVARPEAPRSPGRIFATHALLLSAMAAGHLTNTLAVLPGVLAFEFCWLFQRADSQARRKALGLLASLPVAAVLSAFVTLPIWLHLDLVSLSLVGDLTTRLHWDAQPLFVLLGMESYSFDHPFVRNPGWGWWGLALIGALASFHRAGPRVRPFVAGLFACLLSTAVLGERASIGLIFYLVALCAASVEALARLLSHWGWMRVRQALPLMAAALALFLPRASNLPADPYAASDSLAVYTRIPSTPTRSRTFDVTRAGILVDGIYGESSFSPYFSGRAIVFGAFPQGAPLATNVVMSLMGEIAHSLSGPQPTLSETEADLLYLAHVGFLVDRTQAEQRDRTMRSSPERPILARLHVNQTIGRLLGPDLFQLQQATPAIFTQQIELLPRAYRVNSSRLGAPVLLSKLLEKWREDPIGSGNDPSLDVLRRVTQRRDGKEFMHLITNLGIHRATASASRLYVTQMLEPPAIPGKEGAPDFEVLEHREALSFATVDARASHSGYVRLSYSFDPDLEITLDGRPVPAVAEAVAGGVVVAFPAGRHTLSIRGAPGNVRIILLLASAILATSLVGWLIASRGGDHFAAK